MPNELGQTANTDRGKQFNDRSKLRKIQERWRQFKGSQPNGTGETGLDPSDAQGWGVMNTDNTWALNQLRAAQGEDPYDVQLAPQRPTAPSMAGIYNAFAAQRARGANQDAWDMQERKRGFRE